MLYEIDHITRYRYSHPVGHSSQIAHLCARAHPGQRLLEHALEIEPGPAAQRDDTDYFGNPITRFELVSPHKTLLVRARSRIEVIRPASDLPESPPWESVQTDFLSPPWGLSEESKASEFLFASPFIPHMAALRDFCEPAFSAGLPVLEACRALMEYIHQEFTFDPEATHVATPLEEVLTERRGVCQDFAHLMIGCLRARGIPARYMSGYLLTEPPPGQPRLEGADASHAWVAVFVPDLGWHEFDPTNNMVPAESHIVFAWGRDFGDVSPLRGVILGGGAHEVRVAVTVRPLDEAGQTTPPEVDKA